MNRFSLFTFNDDSGSVSLACLVSSNKRQRAESFFLPSQYNGICHLLIINRPRVARAVLQTPSLLNNSLSESAFSSKYATNLHSQAVRTRELKFWENVYLPPPVRCHMTHVICDMSCVTWYISPVTCHMSVVTCIIIYLFYLIFFFIESGETGWWRVCYQRGQPHLFFLYLLSIVYFLISIV